MRPVTVLISYATQDESLFKQLEIHLTILKKQNLIRTWHEGMIAPGDEWRRKAQHQVASADILLVLASPEFLASDYLYDAYMTQAIKRHDSQEMVIIPIIIRECEWTETALGKLRPLPAAGEPIRKWQDQDAFWKAVAVGLREAIRALHARKDSGPTAQGNPEPPSATEGTASVREAYRLLHRYHRHLLNICEQVLQASSARMGLINGEGWGSHLFDPPVRRDRSPLRKWAYDFIPLAHANMWWATSKKPVPGATLLAVWHCGDTAVEAARSEIPEDEPDARKFLPVEETSTTLSFYVQSVTRLASAVQILDWNRVDVLIEGTRGFDRDTWTDGRMHEIAAMEWAFRYAGISCDVSELQSKRDVKRVILDRLLPLIDQVRAP